MSKRSKVLHQCSNYLAWSHSLSIQNLFVFSSTSKLPNLVRKKRAAEEDGRGEVSKLVRWVDRGHTQNSALMAKPLLASSASKWAFIWMRRWQMKLQEWSEWQYKTFPSWVLTFHGGWSLSKYTEHCIFRKKFNRVWIAFRVIFFFNKFVQTIAL